MFNLSGLLLLYTDHTNNTELLGATVIRANAALFVFTWQQRDNQPSVFSEAI